MPSTPHLHAKQAVLKAARHMVEVGLVVGQGGNVSMRIEEDPLLVAITPTQHPYKLLRPEMIPVVNLSGELVQGRIAPSTETSLHLDVYRGRNDVRAIIHCHPPHATACAVAGLEIPPIVDEMVVLVGGAIRLADYGFPGTRDLASKALKKLGTANAVLLRNHGLLAVGKNITDAIELCHLVENTAKIFLLAHSVGQVNTLPIEVIEAEQELYRQRQVQ